MYGGDGEDTLISNAGRIQT
ncbi:hypothetical protein EXD95_18070 [Acinetobacter pittii]|nr:hypothetical protein EXD95_18070 [Acinetobacter pittii]